MDDKLQALVERDYAAWKICKDGSVAVLCKRGSYTNPRVLTGVDYCGYKHAY